jgi:hypothetical protein
MIETTGIEAIATATATSKQISGRIYLFSSLCFNTFAPRPRRLRAARRAALEWHREPFRDQDRTNVTAAGLKRPATSPVVARLCSLPTGRTGASNKFKFEIARADQIAQPACRLAAKGALRLALRASRLRGVEADQANIWLLVVHSDCVAVDHANIVRVDGRGKRRGEQQVRQADQSEA